MWAGWLNDPGMLGLHIVAEDVAGLIWARVVSVSDELLPLDRLFASLHINSSSSLGANTIVLFLIGLSNGEK
jgi:hypothetical protein